ncbi:NF-kappa-B-repressing factor isoform X2 [Callorhinchus milii]|uniref:NFKB repressing factor n=1 Tax=Callorhinchus milii TaxID=7868 RepID=A0A4W3J348_CALMI|nr:NF-kappa-B-repressing factor isoform X2 [Callorhinchus milii]|eukprot:gi/632935803/ref/XP_007891353.1/ PREDICTED: NF-kappa-B-repressing factor isoform X2 [Callorhinchus milii]
MAAAASSSSAADMEWSARDKRQGAEPVEQYRSFSESDRHWWPRRQFILRHMQAYPGSKMEQLLALSVVWTNHIFLGCRYSPDLMEKVFQMAEGIDVGDMGSYELVPGTTTNKRSKGEDNGEDPTAKRKPPLFRPRFRFEPVTFVSSSIKEDEILDIDETDRPRRWADMDDVVLPSQISIKEEKNTTKAESSPIYDVDNCNKSVNGPLFSATPKNSFDYDTFYKGVFGGANESKGSNCMKGLGSLSSYMSKIQENYCAKYEAYHSNPSERYPTMKGPDFSKPAVGNKQGYKGLGFTQTKKSKGRKSSKKSASKSAKSGSLTSLLDESSTDGLSPSAIKNKQHFFNMLQIAVSRKLSTIGGFSNQLNHSDVLSNCIQTCKTNPQYFYVSLKEIPPADVPRNKKMLSDGYACELRCQGVYLSTGYAGSKIGARDRASEQALKLFFKDVVVELMKRKCKTSYIDDLVLCEKNTTRNDIPPALKKPDEKMPSKDPSSKTSESKPSHLHTKDYKKRHWTEFVILETAKNAVCILNNSAQFNRMAVDYKFQQTPNQVWQCRVFIEDHFIAEAYGTKKLVKHTAADKALDILRQTQPIVKSSKPGNADAAISRSAILGRSAEEALKQKITEDNIGNQLLRKMGWKGGGLGKEGEGIAEPIMVKEQFRREGLGLEMAKGNSKLNKRDIEDLIRNYARSDRQDELTFSKELNNDERMQIHQIAAKYGLKSKSYGKGRERYLVVSRKVRVDDIMNQLVQEGQVGRFELVVPGCSY